MRASRNARAGQEVNSVRESDQSTGAGEAQSSGFDATAQSDLWETDEDLSAILLLDQPRRSDSRQHAVYERKMDSADTSLENPVTRSG